MSCCWRKSEEIRFFVKLYKYLDMSKYKAKYNHGVWGSKGYTFKWRKATQEELAFAYEELGLTDYVEKLNNEKQETTSKKTKKSSKTDKGKE
jgi:hypothetical protein